MSKTVTVYVRNVPDDVPASKVAEDLRRLAKDYGMEVSSIPDPEKQR